MNALEKPQSEANSNTRWWDPLSALLLICALLTAVTRLVVTRWTEELYIIQTLVFIGALLGMAIGQSRFSKRVVFWMSLGYSIVIVPWQLNMTGPTGLEWQLRLQILYQRLQSTTNLLIAGKPVQDNILFLTLMSCLFWVLSLHAGYSLTRYAAPWQAVLPSGLGLLVIQSYDPYLARRAWFLAAYLLFSLTLVSRVYYIRQRYNWRLNRMHLPPDVGFDWTRFSVGVVVFLTLFSWTIPALAQTLPTASHIWEIAHRPLVSLQDKLSNGFASLRSSVGLVNDYYSNRLSLGRGVTLSDNPIFSVTTPLSNAPNIRYYWRAYVYDDYQNGQWKSTQSQVEDVNADKPFGSEEPVAGRVIQLFGIKPYSLISTVYTPAQPLWVSVPARVTLGVAPDGMVDVAGLQARDLVSAGNTYQVESSITNANAAELQAAGTNYPQWILDHYLKLPPDITSRTRRLAQDLSGGLTNPYDIAEAVTNYLRTYTYSETIAQPPSNQELMDWWLFDYKKGFCQYYSTAEVVLLRSLGIPARMAVGFAQGVVQPGAQSQGQETSITYLARQRDSHAWPEVYFPGIGWVEFEPTTSQTPLIRPSGTTGDQSQNSQNDVEHGPSRLMPGILDKVDNSSQSKKSLLANAGRAALYIASALAAGLLLFSIFYRRVNISAGLQALPIKMEHRMLMMGLKPPAFLYRWARYTALSTTQRSYLEINRALSRLGRPPALHQTPAERAGLLVALLPASVTPVQSLLEVYERATYSQLSDDPVAAQTAGKEIRKLSYLAALQRLLARFQEPTRRLRH
jgi:transglutaminase-like putative cysteine protease